MSGEPLTISFKDNTNPHAIHTPIKVPIHWEEKIQASLQQDERLKILEKVPPGTSVKWCTRMVPVAKKNGDPRRTIDYQKINNATLRETHYTPTPFNIVSRVPKNSLKTVLDAWNGYHSLLLADESKDATTFITQWGRYRYKRAPQGFHASGDAYTSRFDIITADFKDVSRCVDDSLLCSKDIESAFWETYEYIKHCSDNGIVFNVDKFQFAADVCEYAGFELVPDGFRPPERKLKVIKEFPCPKTITDVRSWFGLINQFKYACKQINFMSPLRDLLKKKGAQFYWDDTLTNIFEKSKEAIIEAIKEGVKSFERNRVTCIAADYSKTGLGYTLSQKYCSCDVLAPNCGEGHWRITLCGSRFCTPAEARYSPTEGEALAAVYGLQQCKEFLIGCPDVILATDHQALLSILNNRALESITNPRLVRLKEKTLMYNFKVVYVPGKEHHGPDFLSRYPAESARHENEDPNAEDKEIEEESKLFAIQQSSNLPASVTWDMVNDAAITDKECVRLKETILNGFPEKREMLPTEIKYFWPWRDELYVIENVPFREQKMLIPFNLRQMVLEGLHAGHQGTSSMSANARERLFWPHLDADIRQIRAQCRQCTENAPSQQDEPPMLSPDPEEPFEQVVIDMCKINGHTYIVYADRYSGWTEVEKIQSESFKSTKKWLTQWFRTFGRPQEISTDGGPPFNSQDFANFAREWGFQHRKSSAYYAQSNGRAEVAVKTVKRLLLGNINTRSGELDSNAATRAIMAHRNTPAQRHKMSPAEILYGRKITDHLPSNKRKLRKDWRHAKNAKEIAYQMKDDNTYKTKILQSLNVGDTVSIQNQTGNQPKKWNSTGKIVEVLPHRKYRVLKDGSQRVTDRNRKFLKRIPYILSQGKHPNLPLKSSVETNSRSVTQTVQRNNPAPAFMPTRKNTSCKPSQIVPAIANLQQPSIADQQNPIANRPEPSSLIDQSMMSGRPNTSHRPPETLALNRVRSEDNTGQMETNVQITDIPMTLTPGVVAQEPSAPVSQQAPTRQTTNQDNVARPQAKPKRTSKAPPLIEPTRKSTRTRKAPDRLITEMK